MQYSNPLIIIITQIQIYGTKHFNNKMQETEYYQSLYSKVLIFKDFSLQSVLYT